MGPILTPLLGLLILLDAPQDVPQVSDVSAGPAVERAFDADGDGVADGNDRCPGTPAGFPVLSNGCARDVDEDGVADGIDDCPATLFDALGIDGHGCSTRQRKKGRSARLLTKLA
ncbi:MAG: thrombospondin type 3 repeat-containing protein [Acidobacteriota bacterium]